MLNINWWNDLNLWIYYVYDCVGVWFSHVMMIGYAFWCYGLHDGWLGSLELVLKSQNSVVVMLMLWCLTARGEPLGDRRNQGSPKIVAIGTHGAWRRVVPARRFGAISRVVTCCIGRCLHRFGWRPRGDDFLGAHLRVAGCNGELKTWSF